MSDDEALAKGEQPSAGLEKANAVLLLSGGGFRATLFHLGVVRYLLERDRLAEVQRVFSVSGGSILAGFLAANWDEFSDPTHFARAARAVINYAQSDARGRLLRRVLAGWAAVAACLSGAATLFLTGYFPATLTWWLAGGFIVAAVLLFWFNPRRVAFFARDLASNIKKINLDEVKQKPLLLRDLPSAVDKPSFYILTTDLTSGRPWAFMRSGAWMGDEPAQELRHETYPLGNAVAASAAFPPLFPPLPFPKRIDRENLLHDHFLADGGVHDNLGIEVAHRHKTNGEEGEYIISNAERRFEKNDEGSLWLLPKRAARATDILMNRASTLHSQLVSAKQVRLADEVARDEVTRSYPASVQRVVRNVRTDLNRFTDEECQLLYFSGYLAAWETLDQEGPPLNDFRFSSAGMPLTTLNDERWLPFANDLEEDPLKALSKSAETSLGLRSGSDRWGHTLLSLALLFLLAMTPPSWSVAKRVAELFPSSPSLPTGVWESRPKADDDDLVQKAVMSIWRDLQRRREEYHGAAVFVSEPLSQSYGWPPSGPYDLRLEPTKGNRLGPGTRAHLLHQDGSQRELRRTGDAEGFSVTVPGDQAGGQLCFTILLGREGGDEPPNPVPSDKTIKFRILQPHEKDE